MTPKGPTKWPIERVLQMAAGAAIWYHKATSDSQGFDLQSMGVPWLVYSFGIYSLAAILLYGPSVAQIKDLLGAVESLVIAYRKKS